jgi:hypothetical protein
MPKDANAMLCYYAMLSISTKFTLPQHHRIPPTLVFVPSQTADFSVSYCVCNKLHPSHPPSPPTVNTDRVIWSNIDAQTLLVVAIHIHASSVSPHRRLTLRSIRLDDKPCRAIPIVLLLHELQLWAVASTTGRFLRFWRWRWYKQRCESSKFERKNGQGWRKRSRFDECDLVEGKAGNERSREVEWGAAKDDMPEVGV